jgi:hypothetical protein
MQGIKVKYTVLPMLSTLPKPLLPVEMQIENQFGSSHLAPTINHHGIIDNEVHKYISSQLCINRTLTLYNIRR